MVKENSLGAYKAKKVLRLLKEQIASVKTIQDWAVAAGVSKRWLYQTIDEMYESTPAKIMRSTRYEAIRNCLKEDPEMTGYCIAITVGLHDEKALYKLLSTHFDTSLTILREEILKEKPGK